MGKTRIDNTSAEVLYPHVETGKRRLGTSLQYKERKVSEDDIQYYTYTHSSSQGGKTDCCRTVLLIEITTPTVPTSNSTEVGNL